MALATAERIGRTSAGGMAADRMACSSVVPVRCSITRYGRPAPRVDAVVGYRNDVGVLQSSERRGLGAKSGEEFRAMTG